LREKFRIGAELDPQPERSTALEIVSLNVQIASRDIALFCNLMAGYEGVAIVRTLDPRQGLVELLVAPDFCAVALTLLHIFSQEMELRLLPSPDVSELP
jgi:hypothetical protein